MKFAPRKTVLAQSLKVGGQDNLAFDRNGNINASSRKDLVMQIAAIMEAMEKHEVVTEEEAAAREQTAKENRELLIASFDDPAAHRALGEVLANDLHVTGKRQGFMRRVLARAPLQRGADPKVFLRQNNVITAKATSITRIETQYIWDPVFYPQEFYITGRVFVEKKDIDRSNSDVLQEKFNEGLAHLMVTEDRVLYDLVTATVNTENELSNFVGTFNPNALGVMFDQVQRWGIPVQSLLIATDLWRDFMSDTGFQQALDPVTKYELVSTGVIGTIKGTPVISDAYRFPEHKVLNKGDLILFGAPDNLGQYTDRDGVTSEPITMAIEGTPGRGWIWTESISAFLANARAVAKGNRI